MLKYRRLGIALLAIALLAVVAAPVRAAEPDKYLPEDTESIVVFNFQQLLDSKLIKDQVGHEEIRRQLNSDPDVKKHLTALGIDPMKDLHRMIVASPADANDDQGLIILRGKFDVKKFNAMAAKLAKDSDDVEEMKVKDLKGNLHVIYKVKLEAPAELPVPLPPFVFLGIPSSDAILAGFSKDYLLDGMQVQVGQKAKLKNKKFADVLTKLDEKQTMAIATTGEVVAKGVDEIGNSGIIPAEALKAFKELDAFLGGITIDDGIRLKLSMVTKNAKAAKDLDTTVTNGLNQAKLFVGLFVMQQPMLQPLLDFVNSLKTSTSEMTVTLKGGLDADDLKKLIPQDQ